MQDGSEKEAVDGKDEIRPAESAGAFENSALADLSRKLDELKEMFSGKIARDRIHAEAYEKLYQEMRLYKDNFLAAAVRPILMDLLLLYDSVRRISRHADAESASGSLRHIEEELLEILYRQDVEPIPDSDVLDKGQFRVLKTVPTDIPEEDGVSVETVRCGFLFQGKVLRPREVVCKKYRHSDHLQQKGSEAI